MNKKPIDPETLKIPAYMRKKAIVSQSRQKLLLTALDRKDAGLKPNSKRATAPKKTISKAPRAVPRTIPVAQEIPAPSTQSPEAQLPLKPKKLMIVGEVTHYLDNIQVAIIQLSNKGAKNGDILLIEGEDYIYPQPIEEMQIERKPVKRAKKGSHIGLKVAFEAEIGGKVYKLT